MPDLTLSSSIRHQSISKISTAHWRIHTSSKERAGRSCTAAFHTLSDHAKEFGFCRAVKYSFLLLIAYRATLPVRKEKPVIPHIFLLEHAVKLSFKRCAFSKFVSCWARWDFPEDFGATTFNIGSGNTITILQGLRSYNPKKSSSVVKLLFTSS